ncbi:methyltransferase domain-containing protein [Candidatus Micrarchaeota archaeon]|nr:methyltransferase domain-containing protein [Candidatus Micrarchaeota archaeon]
MRFPETVKKLKRGPQVVLPKDFGVIVGFTGVGSRSLVVDAGAGSGFLAIMLGNVAGKVVSYEWREEFATLAEENVKRTGLKNVEIVRRDIFLGIEEKGVDLVTLDLANSEKALGYAHEALRENGYAVGYLPNVEQVKRFVEECERLKFREIFTIECIVREILVRKEGCRPETKGLLHTAYLTFAKK